MWKTLRVFVDHLFYSDTLRRWKHTLQITPTRIINPRRMSLSNHSSDCIIRFQGTMLACKSSSLTCMLVSHSESLLTNIKHRSIVQTGFQHIQCLSFLQHILPIQPEHARQRKYNPPLFYPIPSRTNRISLTTWTALISKLKRQLHLGSLYANISWTWKIEFP